MQSERMAWMDHLRGFTILLVILFHAGTATERFTGDMPAAVQPFLDAFAPFRMPILVFVSGMLLSRSLAKPGKEYALGKLRGIGWPYLVWSLIFLAVTSQLTLRSTLAIAVVPPNYMWFLWFLLIYYALAWWIERFSLPLPGVIAFLFIASFGPEDFRISRFFFLFVFFLLGHLCATRAPVMPAGSSRVRLVPLLLITVAVSAWASIAGNNVKYEPLFIAGPLAATALCVMVLPILTRQGFVSVFFGFMGRNSLVFYASHVPVLWIVGPRLAAPGHIDENLVFVVCAMAALGVGFGLAVLAGRSKVVAALFRFPGPTARIGTSATGSRAP